MDLLAKKGIGLQSFAVMQVVKLLCRITKYAWFDEGSSATIRKIVEDSTQFLEATIHHCSIGLCILNELVAEMNVKNRNRTLTQQRKVSVSFRDICLGPIPTVTTTSRHVNVFETALSMLNQIATRQIKLDGMAPLDAAKMHNSLLMDSLKLLSATLNYDFIGTNPDDSTEDVCTLHVPATWAKNIQSGSLLRLLFNIYKGCTTGRIHVIPDAAPPSILATVSPEAKAAMAAQPMHDFPMNAERGAQTLEVISSLISVRRSIFASETDRKRFLGHILRGVVEIERDASTLPRGWDSACFHEFCKLLARLKNNFQLMDLVRSEGYSEWVKLTAQFTIHACNPSSGSNNNNLHYLLSLWSKLVASVPFAKLDASSSSSSSASASAAAGSGGSSALAGAFGGMGMVGGGAAAHRGAAAAAAPLALQSTRPRWMSCCRRLCPRCWQRTLVGGWRPLAPRA